MSYEEKPSQCKFVKIKCWGKFQGIKIQKYHENTQHGWNETNNKNIWRFQSGSQNSQSKKAKLCNAENKTKTKQRQTNNCLKTRIRPATGHPSCNSCYGNKSLSKIVNEEIR